MDKNIEPSFQEETQNNSYPEEHIRELALSTKLLKISRKMASYDSLDKMLAALIDIVNSEVDAERTTIFLHDTETDELYSRVAIGQMQREIRILEKSGVAGWVFSNGESTIVHDAYNDERFDKSIDEKMVFTTQSILCVPIRTVKGEIIGVTQALNKRRGSFNDDDLTLLETIMTQAAVALQTTQLVEKMKKAREQEMEFFDVVSDVISEIDLGAILRKVMSQATKMLNAERSTLFLNDEKTGELFSQVGEGLDQKPIRLPNDSGIAGAVFTSGKSVNIPHAYADLRFNPSFDQKTGFFTRSILCVPVVNKNGKTIGVTQILNKRGGPFTDDDEYKLRAFTAQVSIALENAKLFDEVQNMKNYSEGMLESMSSGVITLNEDRKIVTCNASGLRILGMTPEKVIGCNAGDFFTKSNEFIMEKVNRVEETQVKEEIMDAEIKFEDRKVSSNISILPLLSVEKKKLGSMIMIEDISNEKRIKSTMARYMDPGLADKILEEGEDILGGKDIVATVLFSDIRGFTTLTEELGAQGTVALLNEYFTIMVDCIQKEGGMLDKFIGDAIMAGFGIPVAAPEDEDRAVKAAIQMILELFDWNKTRAAHGKKPVDMGIGLNTDKVVTGNIGSPKRMDYTMIGDGVNLASRLESACKQYSTKILVSEFTYARLTGRYRSREVDRVVVKGKTKPVNIYEILEYHNNETFPNIEDVLYHYRNGLSQFRKQNWEKAISSFQLALKANKNDKLSEIYISRCRHYIENPPGNDWDGVYVMKTK